MSAIKTLQQIDPKNALLYLDLRTQYNSSTANADILVDGNMEAVGTAAWLSGNSATLSKQSASPTTGQCLRVARNGVNSPYAYQSVCANGGQYIVKGFARGDGTIAPNIINNSGITIWQGTSSTTWQAIDATFTAPGAIFGLMAGTSTSGYAEFDNVTLQPVPRVTRNLGKFPGALAEATLGDGVTSTTWPTQLVGRRGVSLNGSNYIDTGIVDAFERTDKFTLFAVSSSITTQGDLISWLDAANSLRGCALEPGDTSYVFLDNVYPANSIVLSKTGISSKGLNTFAVTYSGSSLASGFNVFVNGSAVQMTTASNTLTSTIKSGKPIILGARHNGAAKTVFYTGNLHHVSIWPFVELTPQQVLYLDRSVMRSINLP